MQMRKIIAALRVRKIITAASGAVLDPSTAVDGLFLASIGSITYGAALIYRPAGFIVGGLLGLCAAVFKAMAAKS